MCYAILHFLLVTTATVCFSIEFYVLFNIEPNHTKRQVTGSEYITSGVAVVLLYL